MFYKTSNEYKIQYSALNKTQNSSFSFRLKIVIIVVHYVPIFKILLPIIPMTLSCQNWVTYPDMAMKWVIIKILTGFD